MNIKKYDIAIIGAGPVGLMCAFLAKISGLLVIVIDKSDGPIEVGRADAINARTLQFLEIIDLFDELYSQGKICNTSSVWSNGRFVSRESRWWDEIKGCFHKHFLMLGQSHVEKLLDKKLSKMQVLIKRNTNVIDINLNNEECITSLSNQEKIISRFVIGADGAHSFVRKHFKIPFEIHSPNLTWAVIDGIIDTDFTKVPEIIVFQNETSDVAWIPREGEIDRFYIRMDSDEFEIDDVLLKINKAIKPFQLKFKKIQWYSQFSVKESVADNFIVNKRIIIAGDAAHIHSVNGGQGLNTGIADAFNLIWKMKMIIKHDFPIEFLDSYETERKEVAKSVISSSGELVRSTIYSLNGTHALDYVNIVEIRAGNITGMGIRYNKNGLIGMRVFDFLIYKDNLETRLYSLLDYSKFTLIVFNEFPKEYKVPEFVRVIQMASDNDKNIMWTADTTYKNMAILLRPDAYIQDFSENYFVESLLERNFKF